jgi:uncharacterized protein (DUF302 family)
VLAECLINNGDLNGNKYQRASIRLWLTAMDEYLSSPRTPARLSDKIDLRTINELNPLKEKGMTKFNRIKHSEGAGNVAIELRDTELIIFGNPKVGSPLMKCQQSVAIDLPQKALIWEDKNAKVWITYNDPKYLQKRHNITTCEEVILRIEKVLASIANSA